VKEIESSLAEARIGLIFLQRRLSLARKWLLPLALVGLVGYAFFLRCAHLFNSGYYYIVSMDSYFFHWLAGRVMAGQGPPTDAPTSNIYTLHSGLAYPLAYIAKGVGYVFNLSSASALEFASKFLPPVLGVIGLVVVYWAVTKIYDRRVGLFSAFAWALMLFALTVTAAGYLDRDGLSMLLIMIAAFIFFLSDAWHFKVGNRDAGWLVGGLGVLLLEGLIYLEWTWAGAVLLLVVLIVYFAVELLLKYFEVRGSVAGRVRTLTAALNRVNWRTFTLIVLGNIVAAAVYSHEVSSWFSMSIGILRGGNSTGILEAQGLTPVDIFSFAFFLIPLGAALYLTWTKKNKGSVFFSCWFISLLVLSIFSRRVLVYTVPAACVLSGVGLVYIWNWGMGRGARFLKRLGVVALLGLLVFFFSVASLAVGGDTTMAPDKDWQDALTYLREQTPQNSVIMSQWSWGYWILDLGQRRPLVDNGYYGYNSAKLHDVGLAYSTTDPAAAAQLMGKYGAGYLVFSEQDLDRAAGIMEWAGLGEGQVSFPEDSLVMQSLGGEFEGGGGLYVAFRNPEVVILGLN
jgi:asparagine N-glycosylation enzyme membrane subunit Stt3